MTQHHEYEEASTGDLMRTARNEYLAWSIASDAQDLLHVIRDMTPKERANIIGEVDEAMCLLAQVRKECQW